MQLSSSFLWDLATTSQKEQSSAIKRNWSDVRTLTPVQLAFNVFVLQIVTVRGRPIGYSNLLSLLWHGCLLILQNTAITTSGHPDPGVT